jgi:sporulation protein YlmC with PRC-barrel domain
MLIKSLTAGIVGTALLTSVAFAQTPSTTTTTTTAAPAMASDSTSHKGQWRTSKLVGLNVYNDNNEKLGDINELLLDQSGKVQAVIIGVGGFLGMGSHDVAVAFDKLKFVTEPVAYAAGSGAPGTTATRPAGTSTMAPTTTTGAATGTTSNTAPSAAVSRSNPWYPDHAMLSASKDQLKAMTEFKYTDSSSK